MFYGQCWKCGQRWELGTASTCICPDEAPKREWQGLTEEEICPWFQENTALTNEAAMRITRAIEAKLKAKNGFLQTESNT